MFLAPGGRSIASLGSRSPRPYASRGSTVSTRVMNWWKSDMWWRKNPAVPLSVTPTSTCAEIRYAF